MMRIIDVLKVAFASDRIKFVMDIQIALMVKMSKIAVSIFI